MSAIARGATSNLLRLMATTAISVVVPPLLTGALSVDEYSAWVALLQLSSYIGLLDLGMQTVVARSVASQAQSMSNDGRKFGISNAVILLGVASIVGVVATVLLCASVPMLFPTLPRDLESTTQLALFFVGVSSAVTLPFGPFLAAFTGHQRYLYPTVLGVLSKLSIAVAVIVCAKAGFGLVGMALAQSALLLSTSVAQYVGWKLQINPIDPRKVRTIAVVEIFALLKDGSVISLWMLSGLMISGVDLLIVGHFDFIKAGAYGIAATAVNFLVVMMNGLFGPLLPASATLKGPVASQEAAKTVVAATRYAGIILVLSAGTLALFAYPILVIWVGPKYAADGAPILQVLLVGHAIRQLGLPLSIVIVGRGQQIYATVATLSEAAVNLFASLVLVAHLGALGVALGTVIGSAVSLILHFTVSIPLCKRAIDIHRSHLLLQGVARPMLLLVPIAASAFFYRPYFWAPLPLGVIAVLATALVVIGVCGSSTSGDRARVANQVRRFI